MGKIVFLDDKKGFCGFGSDYHPFKMFRCVDCGKRDRGYVFRNYKHKCDKKGGK